MNNLKTEAQLADLPGPALVAYYNEITGGEVKKFSTRAVGMVRIKKAHEEILAAQETTDDAPITDDEVNEVAQSLDDDAASAPVVTRVLNRGGTEVVTKRVNFKKQYGVTREQFLVDYFRKNPRKALSLNAVASWLKASRGVASDTLCRIRQGKKCDIAAGETLVSTKVDGATEYTLEKN